MLPVPDIPEASDRQFRYIPEFYEVWHCAGLWLMENSFDNAHPNFVHSSTFGIEQKPFPHTPDSFQETEFGLCMTYVLSVFNYLQLPISCLFINGSGKAVMVTVANYYFGSGVDDAAAGQVTTDGSTFKV